MRRPQQPTHTILLAMMGAQLRWRNTLGEHTVNISLLTCGQLAAVRSCVVVATQGKQNKSSMSNVLGSI